MKNEGPNRLRLVVLNTNKMKVCIENNESNDTSDNNNNQLKSNKKTYFAATIYILSAFKMHMVKSNVMMT